MPFAYTTPLIQGVDQIPTGSFTGGIFSSSDAANIPVNESTGEIDATNVGNTTIRYTLADGCYNEQALVVAAPVAQIDNLNSMSFDRLTQDQVILREIGQAANATTTGSGSVSLWFKTSSSFGTTTIGNLTGGSGFFQYLCIRSNKLVNFVLGTGFGYIELTTVAVNDGDWHHLVLSYDSTTASGPRGTFKAYFDGQLTKTLDMNGSTENWETSTLTTIGAYGLSSVSRYFDGLIDEVAAWDVVLTEAEALSIYNATEVVDGVNKTADLNTLTTPPLKWYRMGD